MMRKSLRFLAAWTLKVVVLIPVGLLLSLVVLCAIPFFWRLRQELLSVMRVAWKAVLFGRGALYGVSLSGGAVSVAGPHELRDIAKNSKWVSRPAAPKVNP
jgi:hypothetical protein